MKKLRALVVDDDRMIRSLVKVVFDRAGIEVITAENGFEAIEKLATESVDVVVLDLMMPKLDGFGVIDYLSDFDPDVLARVIVASAAFNAVIDPHVYAVVPKPFSIETLLAVALECAGGVGAYEPDAAVAGEPAAAAETWH